MTIEYVFEFVFFQQMYISIILPYSSWLLLCCSLVTRTAMFKSHTQEDQRSLGSLDKSFGGGDCTAVTSLILFSAEQIQKLFSSSYIVKLLAGTMKKLNSPEMIYFKAQKSGVLIYD